RKLVIEKLSDINAVVEDDNHLIVTDDKNNIREAVKGLLEKGLDIVITTGGTGIAKRDVTIEAASELFDKEVEGFGELCRMLSYAEDSGSRSHLCRAAMVTDDNQLIVRLLGSTCGVKLGMDKLIVPELSHLVDELNKEN